MPDEREQLVMQQGSEIHRLKVALADIANGATTLDEAKAWARKALGEPEDADAG